MRQNYSTWNNDTQTLTVKLNISQPTLISNGINFDTLIVTAKEDVNIATLNISKTTKEVYLPEYL